MNSRLILAWLALLIAWQGGVAFGADWPAYRADAARSGASPETPSFPLARAWTFRPPQAPRPAWPEPGKELHRMDFDYACQPVAAGGRVYIASSADDTVRALDAATGAPTWTFTAGGPIRFAPALAGGRVYAASDDGFVYCLDAATGAEKWRFRAALGDDRILGNGRMISRWPLRTGVLVADGTVYVSAGMWPAEGIAVYALAADSGRLLWCNRDAGNLYMDLPHPTSSAFTGICPQGYLAASGNVLLVPTGRSVPAALDRATGRLLYYVPSKTQMNGGSWTMTLEDIYLNPCHSRQLDDEAFVGESPPHSGDGLAAYALRDGATEKRLSLPGFLQAAGTSNVLYAAGEAGVQAFDLNAWRRGQPLTNCVLWSVAGVRPYSLIAAGRAVVIGGRDAIVALDAATGAGVWREPFGQQVRGLAVADGRLFAAGPSGALACYVPVADAGTARQVPEQTGAGTVAYPGHLSSAAGILRASGVSKGYALVLDQPDACLAAALALRSDLHVIGVLTNAATLDAERRRLVAAGLYGTRVALLAFDDIEHLPLPPYFADLVVAGGAPTLQHRTDEDRLVHPGGGVVCLLDRNGRVGASSTSDPLPGAGDWRWEMADAGRTGVSDEKLARLPAELLWFGGPGPDRMMDRHWHTATPLCVGGRVFVKGQHHVIAFDAYNGRELWSTEIRGAGREAGWFAGGSFVADDDSLYAAVGDACLRLDQVTGRTLATYRLPTEVREAEKPVPPPTDAVWPTVWQVVGPFPKNAAPLPNASLRRMPGDITVGGQIFKPAELEAIDGRLDFSYLYGGYGFAPVAPAARRATPRGEGTRDMAATERTVCAFATITCPRAGRLTMGAGADWWMEWFVDGLPVFDTLASGNRVDPYAATNHVFTADVSAGEHVLCARVKAGSMSWCLVSDGGAAFARGLPLPSPEQPPPPWGWAGVAGDLLLGIRFSPNGTGRDLFALGRDDGRLRWAYHARHGLNGDCVAIGDGRLYLTDATSAMDADAARRGGRAQAPARTLLALDPHTGAEVWRQEEKARAAAFWQICSVQYARGVVVLDGTAAFDAASGTNIWRSAARLEKMPAIHGDRVIAWPHAIDLRTGRPCEIEDALGRGPQPLHFPRAYGCGEVGGCANLLLFRSGMTGMYDFEAGGTTTFGGVRPNCSLSIVPAAGLLLCPEGSSGCSCSYNFQTSLALAPASRPRDVWYSFGGEESDAPITRAALNFGAPGDRRDAAGTAWLGWPRPGMPGACAVPAGVAAGTLAPWNRPGDTAAVKGTDRPWVYASGLRGGGAFTVLMRGAGAVCAAPCAAAPAVDGRLDDACWPAAAAAPFANLANLQEPRVEMRACRDAANLYFAFRCAAAARDGRPLPFAATQAGDGVYCRRDDDCEILLTDANQKTGLVLAVACGGGRSGQVRAIDNDDAAVAPTAWGGVWTCAVARTASEWSAEIAVPLRALAEMHLDTGTLRLNAMTQNLSGCGRGRAYLVDPGLEGFEASRVFRPLAAAPAPAAPPRRFTVRLHFCEPDDVAAGARMFNVDLQGRRVLADFDIVKAAGAPRTALVKEFKGVEIGDVFTLGLGPNGTICGLEIVPE